jgi:hypothetical protein
MYASRMLGGVKGAVKLLLGSLKDASIILQICIKDTHRMHLE